MKRTRFLAVALCSAGFSACASLPPATHVATYRPTLRTLPRTILARGILLADTRELIEAGNVYLVPAYATLVKDAEGALRLTPPSVMQKKMLPPSRDRHDFMSLAPYWWPDTSKSNGLPYIRRDGDMNPESRTDHDGIRFQRMADAVEALSLAWYLGGDNRYSDRAATLLRAWFIDSATRMNPNLRFAQAVRGVTDGRGIGIIDLRHMPQLLDGVRLLEMSTAWKPADSAALMVWCREYLNWLRTSSNGLEERAAENNHGTWFDSQAVALALFTGDSAYVREILNGTRSRIAKQISADGSQSLELERTRPIHYSLFNLEPFTQLAEMGRHVGTDLWKFKSPEGASIVAGLRFVAPFSDTSRRWSKPDLVPIGPDEIAIPLHRALAAISDTSLAGGAAMSSSRGGAGQRWRLFYPGVPSKSLATKDSLYSHALAYAASQLRRSATSLSPEEGFPRSTSPDGTWEQRPFNQWTSGFFAGSLWYFFRLTRDPAWRLMAERWTTGLERAKSITTTHDLGFMIFDSFGHGLALTGDAHYREVVEQASRSLSSRFNSRVGAIKSWDTGNGADARRDWKYPVIVDNLMNLEMLFQAAKNGDARWRGIAERHAVTSARAHVRPDGSTAHVALFDPVSGSLLRTVTWQGYSDSSAWARGQAWAIHGFAAAYAHTKNPELLATAQRAADYFIAHLPPDGVPYWDLVHPSIPFTYRDASAGAIAASGLFDLSRHTEPMRARRYRVTAERILTALSEDYMTEGTGGSAILRHSVGGGPQNTEIDVGLVYADYFFVESLLRQRGIFWP